MSKYEESQVNRLIEAVYRFWGKGLSKEDCISGCWITYLEYKNKYGKESLHYWQDVAERMAEEISRIRKSRNERCRIESKLSLNQQYGDSGEEIRSILFPVKGDFTNSVILWEFAKQLGLEKWRIMSYIANDEDDDYIMKKLGISEQRYLQIKAELREDMKGYIDS